MFDAFTESERRSLVSTGSFWLADIPDDQKKLIVKRLTDTFYKWMGEQADESGMVAVGILNGVGLAAFLDPPRKLVPLNEASPAECAGFRNNDEISLTFKLWIDGYKPLKAVLKEFGFYRVFALLGFYSCQDADVHSLIRLNEFLGQPVQALAMRAIKGEKGGVKNYLKGAKSTEDQAQKLRAGLKIFVERNLHRSNADIATDACNTKVDGPAVVAVHGKDFKDRPWNAKNRKRGAYERKQVERLVGKVRAEVSEERERRYAKKG